MSTGNAARGMKPSNRIARSALALALALGLTPAPPAASAQPEEGWAADIPAMLAAGPYAEGEVVACLDGTAAAPLSDEAAVEPLMDLDDEDARRTTRLAVIRSEDLGTEELLRSLADDPSVVFAEPNYTGMELPDDEGDGDRGSVGRHRIGQRGSHGRRERRDRLPVGLRQRRLHVADPRRLERRERQPAELGRGGRQHGRRGGGRGRPRQRHRREPPRPRRLHLPLLARPEQALGCGELGYNAEAAANSALEATDVADRGSHGTHCAGIIAAEWDGAGTSGIASDAKLMVIKNGDATSSLVDEPTPTPSSRRPCWSRASTCG